MKKHLIYCLLLLSCNKYVLKYEKPGDISSIRFIQWSQNGYIYMDHYGYYDRYNLATNEYEKLIRLDSLFNYFEIAPDGGKIIYEITSMPLNIWFNPEYYLSKMGMSEEDFPYYTQILINSTEIRCYDMKNNKTNVVRSFKDSTAKNTKWHYIDNEILFAKLIYSDKDDNNLQYIRLWRYDCSTNDFNYYKDICIEYPSKNLNVTFIDGSKVAVTDYEKYKDYFRIKKLIILDIKENKPAKIFDINETSTMDYIRSMPENVGHIAFLTNEKKLCFINYNDGNVKKYKTNVSIPYTFSPDGSKIAYIEKHGIKGIVKIIENPLVKGNERDSI